MSRHSISAHEPGLTVVVGWDNPLQTFFAQVLKPESADDDDEDNVVLWVGTEPREVITVEDLARHLAPYADLTPQIAEQLRADRTARLGQAPSALQQASLAAVRKAR